MYNVCQSVSSSRRILIIGAGLATLRAAAEAQRSACAVTMTTKGITERRIICLSGQQKAHDDYGMSGVIGLDTQDRDLMVICARSPGG